MAEPEDVPRTFEEIQADSLPTTSVAEYQSLGRKVFLPDIRSVNSSFSSRGIKNRFINLLLNRKKHNDHAAYHVFYWMMEWKTQGTRAHPSYSFPEITSIPRRHAPPHLVYWTQKPTLLMGLHQMVNVWNNYFRCKSRRWWVESCELQNLISI